MSRMQPFPELGCYGLAGHSDSPADLLDEVRLAETLGLGSVFLSERFNLKDAGVLAGAAAAVSRRIGIGTAATNHNTRHPLVTATMATTLHRLSGGRYALGLGRGFDALFDVMGLPRVTGAQLEDVVGDLPHALVRRGRRRPRGTGRELPLPEPGQLLRRADPDPDDGHRRAHPASWRAGSPTASCCTPSSPTRPWPARCATVRRSAEEAGRDPASVRIWSVLATVEESVPEELALRKTVGRLATYLQGYGQVLVDANGWSRDDLARFRADPLVDGYPGAFDAIGTTEQLTHLRDEVIPADWLAASATGSAAHCAGADRRPVRRPARTASSCTAPRPTELVPVVEAWSEVRDSARFDGLPGQPGVGEPMTRRRRVPARARSRRRG